MTDTLIRTLVLILTYSVPACFVYICFSFLFWGIELKGYLKKIAVYAFIQSVTGTFGIMVIPLSAHFLFFIIDFFFLFFLLFREFGLADKFKVSFVAYVVYFAMETIPGMISLLFWTREMLLRDYLINFLVYTPSIVLMAILSFIMHRTKFSPGTKLREFMNRKNKMQLYYLGLFVFIHFVLMVLFVSIHMDYPLLNNKNLLFLIFTVACILDFIVLYLAFRALAQNKEIAIQTTQEMYIDDINQMFTKIRSQRHDFLNHIQVIQAMVRRNKQSELIRYTEELVGEIAQYNEIMQIGHPAFAALVQAKLVTAMEHKIDFDYEFSGLDALPLGIKSIDLVKITGNLIDNAFDEVLKLPTEKRWVELKGWTGDGRFHILVRNPGDPLSEEQLDNIFSPGYSTKDGEHSGLGLYIVKERTEHYKGKVEVESCQDKGTTFRVSIPITGRKVAL